MSGPDPRPALQVLESDASGWCEPDAEFCTVPGAAPPGRAEEAPREPGDIDEDAAEPDDRG